MDIAEAGVRSGNGLVVISFSQVPECNAGCTDATACNYDDTADIDDGSCILPDGCTDETACNYDPAATCDDGTCILPDGCTDDTACNFDPNATCDDGSCAFIIDCAGVCGGIFIEDACGNCYDPNAQNDELTFSYTGSIENWTVPSGVTLVTIEARGAQGGNSSYGTGGLGALIQGTVSVTPGEQLKVLVGEQGNGDSDGAGGGGGSFVTRSDNTPLVIAGGGGGAGGYNETVPGDYQDGKHAEVSEVGSDGQPSSGEYFISDGLGGSAGQGGTSGVSHRPGGGGGGLLTDGTEYTGCHGGCGNGERGFSFVSGGSGGNGENNDTNRRGGFGGGAGAALGGGGGGGYSGGGGGTWSGYTAADWGHGGGGGGSYNAGTDQYAEAGAQSGNGQIIISYTSIPECNAGCTDATACNYDDTADIDDGSCILPDGCTNETACNYDPAATCDDGSCILPDGCTDEAACNFDPNAQCDDGSCAFVIDCAGVCGGIFIEDACGNCYDPNGQNGNQEFTYTGGLQTWTVPADVTEIFIEAYGAEGGTANGQNGVPQPGGLGAHIGAMVTVTPGEVLEILVGGEGVATGTCAAGGGGGSFVVRAGNTPLVVAGGGGGGFHCNALGGNPGGPGQVTENGQDGIIPSCNCRPNSPGGTNGNGAFSSWGGGGAGFFGNGSSNQDQGGFAYVNGAQGGSPGGGYGGGGSGSPGCCNGAGGGGGYSGGAGGESDGCSGGGGGSYAINAMDIAEAGVRSGNGLVVISFNQTPECTPGCTDATSPNYNPDANFDDGSCIYPGCTDDTACNYDMDANQDDGSCIYVIDCNGVCGGPNITDDCGNCYDPTDEGDSFQFNHTGFLQTFIVPDGVSQVYVEAYGAAGGSYDGGTGGLGAMVGGVLNVTPGQQLKLMVGGEGQDGDGQFSYAGGGGGTFVTDNADNPLLIAGGGGGISGMPVNGNEHASVNETGNDGYSPNNALNYGVGGTAGSGATNAMSGAACGGNGGGLLTDGEASLCEGGSPVSGEAFVNGGSAGVSACGANIAGGYGGGGGGGCHGAGGGGGYSGGGGSYGIGGNGGGGGSFNSADSPAAMAQANSGDGYVIITILNTPLCQPGCIDETADNYDPAANFDDGTCEFSGCTDENADNYDANANIDDGSCIFSGCTYEDATNYDANASVDDGSCIFDIAQDVPGCADVNAVNYNPAVTIDDGSCEYAGCTNEAATNYDATVTYDDGSCIIEGCTDPLACNYDDSATTDDGSCALPDGCTDQNACNYDAAATCDNGSCEFDSCTGCTYADALNYSETATNDDGSCQFDLANPCPEDLNEDGLVNSSDLLQFLGSFGSSCE